MENENVSTLQASVVPRVQSTSSQPEEKDAQSLALRLLNKRTRVRLSPDPIDLSAAPGKVSLFAVANARGWFVAATRDASGQSALILSPLSSLHSAFASDTAEDEKPFQPQRRIPLYGLMPIIVTFAFNESKLLVGQSDNSIAVYETDHLFSSGDGQLAPVHTFPAPSSVTLLSIHPNPDGLPELVAVLRDCSNSPGSLAVELLGRPEVSFCRGLDSREFSQHGPHCKYV
ncbi:hypothetical protein F5J12DRAFT_845835, partial [Pisolithus orientalis]|uniref:uncharacterized protein n=1 Tax=Pisolithus orientalis TaxID=936130 RepID=UPI0022254FDB